MDNAESIIAPFAKLLNKPQYPCIFDIEQGHIKRFAEAIGDPNPLWSDEAAAVNSRFKGIAAPPLFLIDMGVSKFAEILMAVPCSLKGFLNGGVEIEYHKPLIKGDRITTVSTLVDIKERTGKSGQMIILIAETTHTNQNGDLVMRERHTFIRR